MSLAGSTKCKTSRAGFSRPEYLESSGFESFSEYAGGKSALGGLDARDFRVGEAGGEYAGGSRSP